MTYTALVTFRTCCTGSNFSFSQNELSNLLKTKFITKHTLIAIGNEDVRIFDSKTREILHVVPKTPILLDFMNKHELAVAADNIYVYDLRTSTLRGSPFNFRADDHLMLYICTQNEVVCTLIYDKPEKKANLLCWNTHTNQIQVNLLDVDKTLFDVGDYILYNTRTKGTVWKKSDFPKFIEEDETFCDSMEKLDETRIIYADDNKIQIRDSETGQVLWSKEVEHTPTNINVISPTEFIVEFKSDENKIIVELWNVSTETRKLLNITPAYADSVYRAGTLFFLDTNGGVTMYDVATMQVGENIPSDSLLWSVC